ncbi:hypothetical protein CDIK_1504 [Cucumispora dikerogammari]|nr:hypothetical protein CDIK_1504 [Cucumispora dikerogammari]
MNIVGHFSQTTGFSLFLISTPRLISADNFISECILQRDTFLTSSTILKTKGFGKTLLQLEDFKLKKTQTFDSILIPLMSFGNSEPKEISYNIMEFNRIENKICEKTRIFDENDVQISGTTTELKIFKKNVKLFILKDSEPHSSVLYAFLTLTEGNNFNIVENDVIFSNKLNSKNINQFKTNAIEVTFNFDSDNLRYLGQKNMWFMDYNTKYVVKIKNTMNGTIKLESSYLPSTDEVVTPCVNKSSSENTLAEHIQQPQNKPGQGLPIDSENSGCTTKTFLIVVSVLIIVVAVGGLVFMFWNKLTQTTI